MSADSAAGRADKSCANCGTAEVGDIKLVDCDKCDLARYCGDVCQQNHREIHEAICKERATELRDELLFSQNESSHFGDCPICFLPIPLDVKNSTVYFCCSKYICNGCNYANQIRELEGRLEPKCPFCRKLLPNTQEEGKKILMKRAEGNDPIALRKIGDIKYKERDYGSAFEYWKRAAALGDAVSHYDRSIMYQKGEGVEKDEEKEKYHLEEAAIGGNTDARYNLGCYEWNNKRFDRAVKHFVIAANLGDDNSLQMLKQGYKVGLGLVSKDDLAAALRAHQAAVVAMKSPQREAAAKFISARRHDDSK